MSRAKSGTTVAVAAGIASVALFAITVKAVASGTARATDERVRRRILRSRSRLLDDLSAVVTPLTSPPLLIICCVATAFVFRGRGTRVWLPIASAPFVAMTAGTLFTATLPQQFAPASSDGKAEVSFPSGHTTGATAEALTIAMVLYRNRVLSRATALAIAFMPLIGGINRLYRDRHWTSDIVAGLSAGFTIATVLSVSTGKKPSAVDVPPNGRWFQRRRAFTRRSRCATCYRGTRRESAGPTNGTPSAANQS